MCNNLIYEIYANDSLCERIFTDSKYDVVVHLACNLLPEQSDISTRTLHENICSLENILYLSLISRVGKVVVLMDWQIYGQYENHNRKTERSELKPETETGRQELLRDKLCEAYRRQGLDVAVLRIGLIRATQVNRAIRRSPASRRRRHRQPITVSLSEHGCRTSSVIFSVRLAPSPCSEDNE